MKRGMATWVEREDGRVLAVFLGTDMSGYPVIQEAGKMPVLASWAELSEVLKDDE